MVSQVIFICDRCGSKDTKIKAFLVTGRSNSDDEGRDIDLCYVCAAEGFRFFVLKSRNYPLNQQVDKWLMQGKKT